MRALLAVSLIAGCATPDPASTCGAGTVLVDGQCTATLTTCGSGTHEMGGNCVADEVTGITIRAQPTISAGPRAIPVFVLGAAGQQVVLNTNRPNAGTFEPPTLTLDERGGTALYTPCAGATPGCAGPVEFTSALASAPTTVVARYAAELVTDTHIGSIEHCSGSGNTLYLDGDHFIYPGKLTIVDGTFDVTGGNQRVAVAITPANPAQGPNWTFEISSVQLGQPLAVGVYEGAYQVPGVGSPKLNVMGATSYAYCPETYQGEFEIHDYDFSTKLESITVSFRQWCANKVVSGCLHIE